MKHSPAKRKNKQTNASYTINAHLDANLCGPLCHSLTTPANKEVRCKQEKIYKVYNILEQKYVEDCLPNTNTLHMTSSII
jgi:hypothetical protein